MRYWRWVIGGMVLSAGSQAGAQTVSSSDTSAAVGGTVQERGTGKPVLRMSVCSLRSQAPTFYKCFSAETTGVYELAGLPTGRQQLSVSCATATFVKLLDTLTVDLHARQRRRQDFAVDTHGCDPRPFTVVKSDFRGHFSEGFEESRFVPCGDSTRYAWVTFTPAARPPNVAPDWPDVPVVNGYPRWFVHWHGTMTGPSRYGHFGVSPYQITVDSIIEIRAPSGDDCRP
jgi:hypothetical protein